MGVEGRGPGGKLGPAPCARGTWDGDGDGDGGDGLANPPEPESAPGGFRCDLCGGEMLERHCKLVCTNCGYQRDCSDP